MGEEMQREAFAQDEGPSQAGSEDEKPTPAEQEAMLKQWQENWDTAPVPRNQAEEIEAQWEACTTYSAMLQLNRDYLHGRLPRTPYMGNLDPETAPLLSGLLQLHDYGLLTVQSQPNEHTDPHFRPAFQHSPEGWYEFRQRAFLDFLMPTDGTIPIEQVKHFCLSLAEHPDIDTQIGVELSHTLKYGDSKVPPSLTTDDDRMIISTYSPQTTWANSYQSLSEQRWVSPAFRKRDLESVPWSTMTGKPKETEEEFWSEFLPGLVTLVQPLTVFVCVKSWESRLDLEALIRELADTVGIEDSFKEKKGP